MANHGVRKMKLKIKKTEQERRSYDTSFKEQAVALAKEIGMKEETKKLKRELEREKKVTAILRDATAFFVRIT
jgi:transposase-like protein